MVIAARINFAPEKNAIAWHPAEPLGSRNHHIGLDGGAISFFDGETFMNREEREKEKIFEEAYAEPYKNIRNIHLRPPNNKAPDCISSGEGDGSYPCYWGVDESGDVVSLVADFLVIAQFLTKEISIEWATKDLGKFVKHSALDSYDLQVALHSDDEYENGLRVIGDTFESALLVKKFGRVMFDTEGTSVGYSGNEYFYHSSVDFKSIGKVKIKIKIATGYKN